MKHGNSGERADSTEKAALHRVSGCDVTKSADRGQSFPKSEKEKAKGRPCRKTIEQRWIARHVDRRRQTRGRPLECMKRERDGKAKNENIAGPFDQSRQQAGRNSANIVRERHIILSATKQLHPARSLAAWQTVVAAHPR